MFSFNESDGENEFLDNSVQNNFWGKCLTYTH